MEQATRPTPPIGPAAFVRFGSEIGMLVALGYVGAWLCAVAYVLGLPHRRAEAVQLRGYSNVAS